MESIYYDDDTRTFTRYHIGSLSYLKKNNPTSSHRLQYGLVSGAVNGLVGAGMGALIANKNEIRRNVMLEHPNWKAHQVELEVSKRISKVRKRNALRGAAIGGAVGLVGGLAANDNPYAGYTRVTEDTYINI